MRRACLACRLRSFRDQLFEVVAEEQILLFPMTAEPNRVSAESQMLTVDIPGSIHHLLPGLQGMPLRNDGAVKCKYVAGLLVQVVLYTRRRARHGDPGKQIRRVETGRGTAARGHCYNLNPA